MPDILYPQVIPISLNHLADTELWKKEKPYEIWMEKAPPGAQRTNVTFDTVHDIPLTDIRQMDGRLPTLEKEGFEVFEQPFPEECVIDNVDDVDKPEKREAVSRYLKMMTDELADRLGATKVLCYDWRIRRSEADTYVQVPRIYFMELPEDAEVREHKIDVSHNIHGDGSPDGIKKQLSYLLNDQEKEQLGSGQFRLRVINLWRPISVVETEPLALCDVQTVTEADWEPAEKIFENWIEESMYLKRNKNHRWYWISKQRPDEVTSFVVWDSLRPGEARVSTPHSSVLLAPQWRGSKPRESIEMRTLVWTAI